MFQSKTKDKFQPLLSNFKALTRDSKAATKKEIFEIKKQLATLQITMILLDQIIEILLINICGN